MTTTDPAVNKNLDLSKQVRDVRNLVENYLWYPVKLSEKLRWVGVCAFNVELVSTKNNLQLVY